MLSRRTILSLIVAVVFVRNCNCVGIFSSLFNPSKVSSYASTAFGNIWIPFTNRKPKTAESDAKFQELFMAPGKKAVVVTFKNDFDKKTNSNGLKSFDDSFLISVLRNYPDAEVIIVDVDKCPKTASKYRVPKTSEKVHFNISLRLNSEDDFVERKLLEMVQELKYHSDPKHKNWVRRQIDLIIDSVLEDNLNDGRLDEKLSHDIHDMVRTLVPQNSQQKRAENVEKGLSRKPDRNVKDVQIHDTKTEKILLGPVSGDGGQEGTTEYTIQLVTTKSDEEVQNALSNATSELVVMFFTKNSLDLDDIRIKKFLRGLLATKSNGKIIQVNVDTQKCNETMSNRNVQKTPSILFFKYGTRQDAVVTSYNKKALTAETMNLFADTVVVVRSDGELTEALLNAAHELIIMNFTDNSLNDNDCDIKMFLSSVSNQVPYIKIIQVNTNTGKCQQSVYDYCIESRPTVLFVKRGKLQVVRMTSYDYEALEAETKNLLTRSKVVDSDEEFAEELSNRQNELIVVFVTDNSLDQNDCDMKKFLNDISLSAPAIKIIQVNANTKRCENAIRKYAIESYPMLVFLKRGKKQASVTGFERNVITEELLNLLSSTEIVNSDDELEVALANAENELIILNITNNSLNDEDCNLKEFLSMFSIVEANIKIIQVNADNDTFRVTLQRNKITKYPTVLFLKRGKMQKSRVTGFDTNAIKAEINTLMSNALLFDSDEEIFNYKDWYMNSELSVVFFTDNSFERSDCEMKHFLSSLSISEQRVKVVQVNTNTNKCSGSMYAYNIESLPTLLFLKRGDLQNTRVIGFDLNAINAEISNLLSRSVVIADNNSEIANALGNSKHEYIILFFTDNSLDKCDCEMKKLLGSLPISDEVFKIVRVNTNTGQCSMFLDSYGVFIFPTLVFMKYGNVVGTKVTSCEDKKIQTEICKFFSRSVVVGSDKELINELSTAANELTIINITDNSFDNGDFNVKIFLSAPLIIAAGIKVIQVNTNTNRCRETISKYKVSSYPLLIFMKNGKIAARVAGFNRRAIQSEINNLSLRSVIVDSDGELDGALWNAKTEELVVVLITDNSVNNTVCDVKEYLYTLSTRVANLKIIQVNAYTGLCKRTIYDNKIAFYPSLLIFNRGIKQGDTFAGFNEIALNAAINASSGIVHSTSVGLQNNRKEESSYGQSKLHTIFK